MKLRELFSIITNIQLENNISPVFITGGIARDKVLDKVNNTHLLKNLNDIDLTTGDNSIHELSRDLAIELGKSYSITSKQLDDGHSSIFLGKLKIDCSSNFVLPNIEQLLQQKDISNPSDLDKEMWSRDFTANALLLTMDMKTIKDPTKQGVRDIKNKILRTCLDPSITLKYNLNRIPRIFYLAAKLDFTVAPEIIKWVSANKELIKEVKPGYLAKTMEKAFHHNAEKTQTLIKQMGLESIIPKPSAKIASTLVFRKNFDYGERNEQIEKRLKRLEIFKKELPNKVAYYFAGNDNYGSEYYPFNTFYYPGAVDDKDAVGDVIPSYGKEGRDGKEFPEFEQFKADRAKRMKRIKRRKILQEMLGHELPDEGNDVVLEGHPFSEDMYGGGGSGFFGLFGFPMDFTGGTIADNPNVVMNPWSKIYQRTD